MTNDFINEDGWTVSGFSGDSLSDCNGIKLFGGY